MGRGTGAPARRVVDARTGRAGVLKQVRAGSAAEQARGARELVALRGLRHPGVVELLDAGDRVGEPWLVTAWIEGVAFPGAVDVEDWRAVVTVAARLCEVLAAVHGAGIVHRDLKPDNVLVTPDGSPVLLDFGLARGTPLGLTVTGDTVLGTPRYLAPEQLVGHRVDARADLYALGVMLWEALTGRALWTGREALQRIARRRGTATTPLAAAAPHLPPRLCTLVDRCLAPAARDRPYDARTVGAELAAVLGGAPPGAEDPLPLLGREVLLAALVADVERGEPVDVTGPPGVGIGRLFDELERRLLRRGHRVIRPPPGQTGLASLEPWLGAPSSPTRAWVELAARLEARLTEGEVLLVSEPHALDTASRRMVEQARLLGRVVRAADTPGARRVLPLTPAELTALFVGPDRVLHLREDAAAELHRRTGGMPAAVRAELRRWRADGRATATPAGLLVERSALDVLAGEPGEPGPRVGAVQLERPGELGVTLDWLACARGPLSLVQLARVSAAEPWLVELESQALVELGLAARTPDGRVEALVCSASSAATLAAPERHRALAAARAHDDPARVHDLLLADDPDGAVEAALAAASRLGAAGRDRAAFVLLAGVARELVARPLRAEALADALRGAADRSTDPTLLPVAAGLAEGLGAAPRPAAPDPLEPRLRALLAELDGPEPAALGPSLDALVLRGVERRAPGLELLGRVLARGVAWRSDDPLVRDPELVALTPPYGPLLHGWALAWEAGVAWRSGEVMAARELSAAAAEALAGPAPGPARVLRALWHALGGGTPDELAATLAGVVDAAPTAWNVEAAELLGLALGDLPALAGHRRRLPALFAATRAARLVLLSAEECGVDRPSTRP